VAENMYPRRAFGRRMKAARILCDLSAIELSQKTGIKISMIRQYESGRCLPGAENLHMIVTALDITTGDLFGDMREKETTR
jgi:transcriptional regulator with XRE-family HTH domain